MSKQLIPCLLLATVGLCFLGSTFTGKYGLKSPDPGIRPQALKNPIVSVNGVISVTTPGGEYIIDRRDVMSISAHTYEIDGGMRVWEVTLSERSPNTIRWYFTKLLPTESVTVGSPSDEGTGGKLDTLDGKGTNAPPSKQEKEKESKLIVPVRKSYPSSTHAHTIEYRVRTLEQLDEIYAYFCLMVYGWSPKHERPPEDRAIYPHDIKDPAWNDWDNENDH